MKKLKTVVALLLAAALIASLAGCAKKPAEPEKPADAPTEPPKPTEPAKPAEPSKPTEPEDTKEPDEPKPSVDDGVLDIAFLNGPTGIGAAWLMEQNDKGALEAEYRISVQTDPSHVTQALVSGEFDVAAVPTNVASILYNNTDGAVQMVAINTLGVLYILENGDSVKSVADLAGKTIYATGQGSNPQFVLEYILAKNGLSDVKVEYREATEVSNLMANGSADICMLPVPAVTTLMMNNDKIRIALDVSEEWAAVAPTSSVLTQGCIVARKTVTDAELKSFLADYEKSIEFMKDGKNADEAAALAVRFGIVPKEPVAKKALPYCGLTFITGEDPMREALQDYYEILYAAEPRSVGGNAPDSGIYREIG